MDPRIARLIDLADQMAATLAELASEAEQAQQFDAARIWQLDDLSRTVEGIATQAANLELAAASSRTEAVG